MTTKMSSAARAEILQLAHTHGFRPELKSDGTDCYDKLIWLVHPQLSTPVFVHKDVGIDAGGRPKYFKVAAHPDQYSDSITQQLDDVRPALNQQSKKNLHSHSGYKGFPLIDEHDQPVARAYRVDSVEGLSALFASLPLLPAGSHNSLPSSSDNEGAGSSSPRSGNRTQSHDAQVPLHIERGLVIAQPWIELILSGEKTWEMRSTNSSIRGRIGLIEKGSGHIVGAAELVNSIGPLSPEKLREHIGHHQITQERLPEDTWIDKWNYAWVLQDVQRFAKPVPYQHPSGAVTWVKF